MGAAIVIGIMALYSIYMLATTGEQKHLYFLLVYIALILFLLRGYFIKKK